MQEVKNMVIACKHRCVIGESPVWNQKEKILYFTNAKGNEICKFNIYTGELKIRPVNVSVAALAFSKKNRLIVSRDDGVFFLNEDNTIEELYNTSKIKIERGNDMKVGPDGRIYVGTQSGKRAKVSKNVDGKLYSIDKYGNVRVLLDGLSLSNGLDWSIDEKYFYHTDSDTNIIKEYSFDKDRGDIKFTGRAVEVNGVDGFTIDNKNNILSACWNQGHIAVIDTKKFEIKSYIEVPTKIPVSCGFAGDNMDLLAIVTSSYYANLNNDFNAGYMFVHRTEINGRKPYLF